MMFHTKKIINDSNLGERLSQARVSSDITIEQASKDTLISQDYLLALEHSDYNRLPGDIYCRCFLKTYAQYLNLEVDEIMQKYCSEYKVMKSLNMSKIESLKPVLKVSKWHFLVTPKILRNTLVALVAVICLVYLGFKVEAIVKPPVLIVDSPTDNYLTKEKSINIIGTTQAETLVTVNGQKVLVNETGKFSEMLGLNPGLNIITVVAKKNHSRENSIQLRVVMQEES